MTEKEAKEILEEIKALDDSIYQYNISYLESLEVAIKALEEIQQYRSIGTVEEYREAVEKQKAKKPVKYDNCGNKCVADRCPNCFEIASGKYCENCGQRISREESEGEND